MRSKTADRRWGWTGLGFFLMLGVAFGAVELIKGWPRESVLDITHAPDKQVLFCARMQKGEEFVVSFTHSVNRRPVYDTFRAEGDHLVIVRSRFDAFGAGMPETSTSEGTLTVAADGWLEWTVNRPLPEVTIRVGRVADHRLHIKGRMIRLAELADPGTPLTLRVRRPRMLDQMFDQSKGRCIP
jgi:hypothetical protein